MYGGQAAAVSGAVSGYLGVGAKMIQDAAKAPLKGAIDNGVYDVSFKSNNPENKIPKTHTVNKGKELDCLNGVNTSYPNFDAHSPTQKNAIYVHRTNIGGFAGYNKEKNVAVSTGCLLIDDSDWLRYETQINFTPYKLVVRRK